MTRLYHFTCEHSVSGIAADMVVIPHRQPVLGGLVMSWWTTAQNPTPAALGLAGHTLVKCDRMAYRFAARPGADIVPWSSVRGEIPTAHLLEAARGGRPSLWWVAFGPVDVEAAPRHHGRMP